jgi:hypothetical protein
MKYLLLNHAIEKVVAILLPRDDGSGRVMSFHHETSHFNVD